MNIKILVCYHKKDTLFKNDILVPIHCGRAVARERSKDGKISSEDYKWLLDNAIGDDTGDNISELNREVNEMTAIYWAWKNYDKLGNPDFIGLCHYRRLFNFAHLVNKPFKKSSYLKSTGNTFNTVSKYLQQDTFIVRTPVYGHDLLINNLKAFQSIVNLSNNYHPKLFNAYNEFIQEKQYYCNNMFVMSREDFFAYCEEIFPIMFDMLSNKNRGPLFLDAIQSIEKSGILKDFDDGRVWLPRLTGFLMEYMSGLYFLYLMKQKRAIVLDCIQTDAKTPFLKNIFSITRRKYNGRSRKVIILFGFVIKL